MLPMITTLCKQQMSVRINQAVRNAQAGLRDAQALEQAGVGTRFDAAISGAASR